MLLMVEPITHGINLRAARRRWYDYRPMTSKS